MLAALAVAILFIARPRSNSVSVVAAAQPQAARPDTTRRAAQASTTPEQRALYRFVTPTNAAALTAALPAPTRAMHYVEIDRNQIEAKSSPFWTNGGRVQLPLPDGTTLTALIDESVMLGANRFTSTGHIEDSSGSQVIFSYNEGFLTASVQAGDHSYALRPATETVTQLYEVDPALVPPCGGAIHPQVDAAAIAAAKAREAKKAALTAASATTSGNGTTTPATAAYDATQAPVVQLLIVYTQAVKTTLSGTARVAALQSEFDAAVAKVNTDFSNSQINARVKLLQIAETQYDETTSTSGNVESDALTALQKTSDGKMDEIHTLRDQIGADAVILVHSRADSSSIGLSYVLGTPSLSDAGAASFNALYAFSVVQYSLIASTEVMPHELGHVFGCAHARGDSGTTGSGDGAFSYSYGYRFTGANSVQYRDIMAYSPGTQLSYFSNPRITLPAPINAAIGKERGQTGEADCAYTIEQTAFEVATYRLLTGTVSAGNLINVSTRAYIGTGDNVLIGGFVITGSQPKQVLIRAAGPALLPFQVTDAIADPILQIYHDQTQIASNDDWGSQTQGTPTATDMAATFTRAGAFSFAAGSKDAAVVLTLNPAGYTAIVSGASGSVGSGLVEAYELDRNGNRLVNIATRGYVAKGKEMSAGFVIQGSSGSTKRVLIRVLGPTLSRAPYNMPNTLYDPMLELHNAAGDTLLVNDDWSTNDTTGTINEANDFSPAVTYYSEKQLAATPYAPANRREPAVLVDLAPGSYTVVIKPFEDLTSTPTQPAQPGLAIVEVYEISQ